MRLKKKKQLKQIWYTARTHIDNEKHGWRMGKTKEGAISQPSPPPSSLFFLFSISTQQKSRKLAKYLPRRLTRRWNFHLCAAVEHWKRREREREGGRGCFARLHKNTTTADENGARVHKSLGIRIVENLCSGELERVIYSFTIMRLFRGGDNRSGCEL